MSTDGTTIHAGCVVIGEAGVLIRGPSGSGKSTLARALVEAARGQGRFARLVADDRVRLSRHAAGLVARPVPAIDGLIEVRGLGLRAVETEPSARIALVVDILEGGPVRLPEAADRAVTLLGAPLPRLVFAPRQTDAAIVLEALRGGIEGGGDGP